MEPRKTFVLWIAPQRVRRIESPGPTLAGRLEEVDTGREFRFQSAAQLVSFLEECLGADESASVEEVL